MTRSKVSKKKNTERKKGQTPSFSKIGDKITVPEITGLDPSIYKVPAKRTRPIVRNRAVPNTGNIHASSSRVRKRVNVA